MCAMQKIYFGVPGTGKSWMVDQEIENIKKSRQTVHTFRTVFHPDYSYGDFVGKLTPIINNQNVLYVYQMGIFLEALCKAYLNPNDECFLIIEEINRGNTSAIFGNIFQLLDRDTNGVSSYPISLPKQAFLEILKKLVNSNVIVEQEHIEHTNTKYPYSNFDPNKHTATFKSNFDNITVNNFSIKLPKNLHILATMNTSDHSIYYMDSAFKRRWDWVYVDLKSGINTCKHRKIEYTYPINKINWINWVDNLNKWIVDNEKSIRSIEDKQIGYFFINKDQILVDDIKNKVMFFIWDHVFDRDKSPIIKLLSNSNLVTFGDFTQKSSEFIREIAVYR